MLRFALSGFSNGISTRFSTNLLKTQVRGEVQRLLTGINADVRLAKGIPTHASEILPSHHAYQNGLEQHEGAAVAFLLSVVAVSLQVILVLLIVGLTSGVLKDLGERAEGVGADLFVQPPNSSIFFALSSANMQESIGERIAKIASVDEVAAVLIVMDTRNLNVVYGIDEPRFEGLSKGFQFLAGHGLEQPDDALADDLVAQARHLHVGDSIELMHHTFRLAGIVVHGKGARFFVQLRTAQDVAGADKRVSLFYIRSKGDTEATRSELVTMLPGYRIRTMAEYMTLMTLVKSP